MSAEVGLDGKNGQFDYVISHVSQDLFLIPCYLVFGHMPKIGAILCQKYTYIQRDKDS